MSARATKTLIWRRLPGSIRGFILAYLGSVVFGIINSFQQFEAVRLKVVDLIELGTEPFYPDDEWVYALIAVRIGLALALLAWVFLRHSLIARIVILIPLLAWTFSVPDVVRMLSEGNYQPVPFLLAGLFSAIAVIFMLTKASRAWFSGKGRTLADDLEDFS